MTLVFGDARSATSVITNSGTSISRILSNLNSGSVDSNTEKVAVVSVDAANTGGMTIVCLLTVPCKALADLGQ